VRSSEWQTLYPGLACHPTQIYEMIYCFVAMGVAMLMYWRFHLERRIGLITGVSLVIFFGSRFLLELLKNPQVARETGMSLNIGQQLSIPLIVLGIYLIITALIKPNFKRIF